MGEDFLVRTPHQPTNLSIMSQEYWKQYYIDHIDEFKERYQKYAKKQSYKERCAKYQKKYQNENREELNKNNRQRYHKNKEKHKERQKAYYQKNKKQICANGKTYYEKNKERLADIRYLLKYADVMAEFVISLDGF